MDHRCLYGHRVPSTYAFAIQNRLCPMCGAGTVTVTGYQVARKLATDASLDAVSAFNVVKVIESEWNLVPLNQTEEQPEIPAAQATPAVVAPVTAPGISIPPPRVAQPAEEDVVVEESVVESDEVMPEPLASRPAPVAVLSMDNVAAVAIPPAAGNVGLVGGLIIGLIAGAVCLWGVTGLKRLLGADDALDVFGVHGLGGILGALLTGIFNSPDLGGPGFVTDWVTAATGFTTIAEQLLVQAKAVGVTVVWSAVVAWVAYRIADALVGLRVSEEEEREGLDINSHGETAYHI